MNEQNVKIGDLIESDEFYFVVNKIEYDEELKQHIYISKKFANVSLIETKKEYAVYEMDITSIYRKDEFGNFKLIWKSLMKRG